MTTDSWDWAVNVLAEELAATPAPIRQQVLKNLAKRAGRAPANAEADHTARVLKVRAELVRRLIARMKKMDDPSVAPVLRVVPQDGRRRIFLQVSCNAAR